MTGGTEFHKTYNNNNNSNSNSSDTGMDVDMEPGHVEGERGDTEGSVRAACSSNGSGAEDDEAREAGGCSSQHTPDRGGALGCGREQEVSVEIGETYLCQRADKTWREFKFQFKNILYCVFLLVLLDICFVLGGFTSHQTTLKFTLN